jgi:hypothetical protein
MLLDFLVFPRRCYTPLDSTYQRHIAKLIVMKDIRMKDIAALRDQQKAEMDDLRETMHRHLIRQNRSLPKN